MYNIAVINFEKKYTFKDELKFRLNKLNQEEFVTIHKIEDKTLKIINIPVTYKTLNNSNRLKKYISLFKRFLNENNIKCILFSDKNNIENILIDYFKEDFFIIKGNTVINYEFYNIIKKYIRINELKDFEIVFYCNDFDLFYNYFKKVYNQFRVEGVITENKIKFKEFAKSIYSDYGIFINIYNEKDFKNSNKYLIINLTDNFIFNNSLDINKINLLYSKNEKFLFLYDYFKYINQNVIEMLIYWLYGNVDKAYFTDFFTVNNMRIVKLNKK